VKVTAKFTRHVDYPSAAAVIAHIHNSVFDPNVVSAAFRHRILGDFLRTIDVADVADVTDAAHRNAVVPANVEEGRKDFIADKEIVAIAIDRMRAGQPAIPVKLVVIETKLADQLRTFRAAALDTGPDIQDHHAVMPVGEISQSIFHIKIMEVTPGDLFAFFSAHGADDRIFSLPAGDLLRV